MGGNSGPGYRSWQRRYMVFTDILLSIVLPLLFSLLLTGLKIHELAGVAFFFLMLLHMVFSWTWIKGAVKRLLLENSCQKRFSFVLNASLYILVVLQVSSGLVISQVAVPVIGIKTVNDWSWRSLHSDCSRILLLVISLHIALNWQRIVGYCGKKNLAYVSPGSRRARVAELKNWLRAAVLILLTTAVIALVVYFLKGAPMQSHSVPWDAAARFKPKIIAGLVQYGGGAIVITILVYMAHRWLKLRL